jgi:hypothetical protein
MIKDSLNKRHRPNVVRARARVLLCVGELSICMIQNSPATSRRTEHCSFPIAPYLIYIKPIKSSPLNTFPSIGLVSKVMR